MANDKQEIYFAWPYSGAFNFYMLIDSVSLRKLDLSWNCFGDDGIAMIIKWLQHNATLTELDLGRCEMAAKGMVCTKYFYKYVRAVWY